MFEIGTSLREARLRQGLDFPEIEQATKIRGRYLRALEDENFEQLPAQTYVKGFLRTYADYLGLEGQLYVDEYNSRYVTGEDEQALRVRGASSWPGSHRMLSSAVVIALTAIGLATALVIAAWKFGAADDPGTVLGQVSSQAKPKANRAKRAGARPVTRRANVRLQVTARRGDSWVEVRRGSPVGPVAYQGTLLRGQTQPFSGKRFWVTVGSPQNVVVKLNGRLARVPRSAGPVDLDVTRRGVRPVT